MDGYQWLLDGCRYFLVTSRRLLGSITLEWLTGGPRLNSALETWGPYVRFALLRSFTFSPAFGPVSSLFLCFCTLASLFSHTWCGPGHVDVNGNSFQVDHISGNLHSMVI